MTYQVKISTKRKLKASLVAPGVGMANKLNELQDVNVSGVQDKYVIMYDATTQKYIAVNPDDVLIAAVTEPVSPGIPAPFVDELDIDLDNKIDLDAGTF
jgi:hypothetical protein